ncbi:hypothetical protein PV327_008558 [Microctonus hyperodae]|uniref:Immunoglobulin I-set domain-containing protein n=1 Tax=Microctonus hyperodae TaxID=165561 RepID=A0AA39KHI7_MICHY|nr:hypothetical protein PV327_008558 [Microctonus hyperodae]
MAPMSRVTLGYTKLGQVFYTLHCRYGQVLPTSRRQEVSTNGTLVLHNVDSSTDRGSYTCTARNKQGHYDAQTVQIEVKGKKK